jgi:hypothetical protein
MKIRIVFVLMIMASWIAHVLDVRGAFLKGDFGDGETLYLHVPQGMTKCYSGNRLAAEENVVWSETSGLQILVLPTHHCPPRPVF